jgi:hypothetical protein
LEGDSVDLMEIIVTAVDISPWDVVAVKTAVTNARQA